MELNKNFWIIFGIIVVLVIVLVVGVVVANSNSGKKKDNNYTCNNGSCIQVSDCINKNCTSKEECEKNCKKPAPPPKPKPLGPPYPNGILDQCLSDKNTCIDCNDKSITDKDHRGIFCGELKTPGIVCNDVFNSFFYNLGLDGFDYIQANSQYYTDYTDPIGALQVAGKNYKNYSVFDLVERKLPSKVIKTIFDLAVPDDTDKISVFLVQAPLSFVNLSISKVISKLKAYETKYPLLTPGINWLIKKIQSESIDKKTITGKDLGLYHSGLVFIKTSDYIVNKNFPSDKIITSLELWGNILDNKSSLWGSALPKVDKNGNVDTSGLVNNIIVSTCPQVFGCTASEYFGNYWDVQYYLGDTTKDIIVELFNTSQDWFDQNPVYISQAVTSNYGSTPPCKGSKSTYLRSITCETFAMDMIKNLIKLDPKNFNQTVFNKLKFTEVVVVGSKYEILNNITPNQKTAINNYSQDIENTLMPSSNNLVMATTPGPTPALGNSLNYFLTYGTQYILKYIANENKTMYTVVMDNGKPKICQIDAGFLEPLKVDIIYDECPANM